MQILQPIIHETVWGGAKLAAFVETDCRKIGHLYGVIDTMKMRSKFLTGPYRGRTIHEWFVDNRNRYGLGNFEELPILTALVEAADNLSIQVHPGDDYALQKEDEYGKNELWYVVDCEPDSYLYCGFSKDTDEEEVRQRIEDGTLPEILNKIPVRKGESYFIETGTVHAIGPGVLICEIQQSSNVTYRLYDYKRRDKYGELRELHVDKAMDVVNFHKKDMEAAKTMECKYFSVERYDLAEENSFNLDDSSFRAFVVLEGTGTIRCGEEEIPYRPADCFFVPAGKKTVAFEGSGIVLKVQV